FTGEIPAFLRENKLSWKIEIF
ncbi:hypothetical protein Zm00014a_030693, partial [Zea mays]